MPREYFYPTVATLQAGDLVQCVQLSDRKPVNITAPNLAAYVGTVLGTIVPIVARGVRTGNMLVVDKVNGSASATRTNGVPFATLAAAKAAAVSGDTIEVLPGSYDEDDILKNGVNWRFWPGAKVERSTGSTQIMTDAGGAVTCVIEGGEFKHSGTTEPIKITNSGSVVHILGVRRIWQNNAGVHAAIRQTAGSLWVTVDELRSDGYDGFWVEAVTAVTHLKAGKIIAKDSAVESAANFTTWGNCYFEVGLIESTASGIGSIVSLGPKVYARVGHIKLAGSSQVTGTGAIGYSEPGILECGVIEAPASGPAAPVIGGDSLFSGQVHIRGCRIIGPTSGNVPPVYAQNVISPEPVYLEDCELVAGAGATYALDGDAGGIVKVIGGLRMNKPMNANVTLEAGRVERQDLQSSLLYRRNNTALANGANQNVALGTGEFFKIKAGPTAAFSIGGITNGVDGRRLTLLNGTGQNMTLNNEDAGSTAANRITTLTGGNVATTADGLFQLIYDGDSSRWILMSVQA